MFPFQMSDKLIEKKIQLENMKYQSENSLIMSLKETVKFRDCASMFFLNVF